MLTKEMLQQIRLEIAQALKPIAEKIRRYLHRR